MTPSHLHNYSYSGRKDEEMPSALTLSSVDVPGEEIIERW